MSSNLQLAKYFYMHLFLSHLFPIWPNCPCLFIYSVFPGVYPEQYLAHSKHSVIFWEMGQNYLCREASGCSYGPGGVYPNTRKMPSGGRNDQAGNQKSFSLYLYSAHIEMGRVK